MKTPPPITGVSEIVLSVADLPKMRTFYTEVLGFHLHGESCFETEQRDPAGEPTITFLTVCETDTPLSRGGHPQMVVLIDHKRHIWAKSRLPRHDVSGSTLNHLAFEIPPESYDEHLARLKNLDLQPTESAFPGLNAKAIFFQDPEGNVLELICHEPA